jgi:predicted nucleic acid-binding Zn ribbon protein/endogenous inhibitor of DNA gyrase (YacG/DUF329 family)
MDSINIFKWGDKLYRKVICKHCGVEFTRSHPAMKFCSAKCRYRSAFPLKARINISCKQCGKDFLRALNGQKFCSKECFYRFHNPLKIYPIGICRVCKKEFKPVMTGQLSCSKECNKKYKGNNSSDRKRIIFIAKIGKCESCGLNNKLALVMHHIKGRENKEEIMVLCANCHTIYHRLAGKGFASENCSKEEVIRILNVQ